MKFTNVLKKKEKENEYELGYSDVPRHEQKLPIGKNPILVLQ